MIFLLACNRKIMRLPFCAVEPLAISAKLFLAEYISFAAIRTRLHEMAPPACFNPYQRKSVFQKRQNTERPRTM